MPRYVLHRQIWKAVPRQTRLKSGDPAIVQEGGDNNLSQRKIEQWDWKGSDRFRKH